MRARKPSDPASGRSSSRLGIAVLVATVAAFLLVPVAQASAAGTLKVKLAGTGTGTVKSIVEYPAPTPPINCPGTCEGVMEAEAGFSVLAAIPSPGSKFTGWSFSTGSAIAACNGGTEEKEAVEEIEKSEFGESYKGIEGACYVAEEATDITATFTKAAAANIKLNFEEGEGTVVSNPAGLECTKAAPGSCEATLPEGKVVLTASPAPGYLVKGWKGCETGGVNGRQCTVTATGTLKNVGIKFYKAFSLKGSKTGGSGIMSTAPGGINCGYACSSSTALYKEAGLTVKAKPAKHFEFVEFKGGTGAAASCNGNKTLECTIASFNSNSTIEEVYAEEAKNTLSYKAEGGGQGFIKTTPANINCGYTCTAAAAQFYASESAAVTVVLGKGTSSLTWTTSAGTCTGKVLTCSVPMSSSKSLVAKFE